MSGDLFLFYISYGRAQYQAKFLRLISIHMAATLARVAWVAPVAQDAHPVPGPPAVVRIEEDS